MERYVGIILDRFCDDVRSMYVYTRSGVLIERATWNPEDGSLTVIYENKSEYTVCKELVTQFVQDCEYTEDMEDVPF